MLSAGGYSVETEDASMQEKVSIIVPVYNAEPYIEQTIKSVLNQEYTNFELILVENGSTDATVEKIKTFLSIIRQ